MANSDFCPDCGAPLSDGACLRCAPVPSSGTIRRDILLLVLMSLLAGAIFLFTRAMAAKERELDTRVGATWHQQGEKSLRSGDLVRAIACFRKATANDRRNRSYALALANALAAAGHSPESQQILVQLRETSPEDADINLQLARLSVKRGDMTEAVSYYHNTLYGVWKGNNIDEERRKARLELIHALLDHHEPSQALSELLILSMEIPPEDAALQAQVAQLFLRSGDPVRALAGFKKVLKLDPDSGAAMAGAGEAAFQLRDYSLSERYFEAAVARGIDQGGVPQLLSLTKMVLSHDPMAIHLSPEERRQRLMLNLQQSLQRLASCPGTQSGSAAKENSSLEALKTEALAMQAKLRQRSRFDSELIRPGMELIYRVEQTTQRSCGEPQGLDRALLLIGHERREAMP